MLARRDPKTAHCRSIVLVPIALGAWLACAPFAMAAEGPSGRLSWNVPVLHFVPLGEQSEPPFVRSGETVEVDNPGDEAAGGRLGWQRPSQVNLRSTTTGWFDASKAVARSIPLLAQWPDELSVGRRDAVAADSVGLGERFDPRRFARFSEGSFFSSPLPTEPAEDFGRGASLAFYKSGRAARPYFAQPAELAGDRGIARPREPFAFAPLRPRPVAPPGTMFIWSVNRAAAAARQSVSSSAGVVLTRPPGPHSLDWIGVAITAPLH